MSLFTPAEGDYSLCYRNRSRAQTSRQAALLAVAAAAILVMLGPSYELKIGGRADKLRHERLKLTGAHAFVQGDYRVQTRQAFPQNTKGLSQRVI